MEIHKEGKFISANVFAFCLVVSGFSYRYFDLGTWGVITFVLLVLLGFVLYFFRVPQRDVPVLPPSTLLSPADGKVVAVERVTESEVLNQDCMLISIFMSPLNVHINWNPISGRVRYNKYHPGKFLVAWHPKSSTDNERVTTLIDSEHGKIVVAQVAGAVARRIINYHEQDKDVVKGEEMGFIRFGSRVDLYLPLEAEILCKPNEKVQGKITPLARLHPSEPSGEASS